MAGKEISDLTQNRANGTLSDYYEGENQTSGDAKFSRNTYPPDLTYNPLFNDQIRIIEP